MDHSKEDTGGCDGYPQGIETVETIPWYNSFGIQGTARGVLQDQTVNKKGLQNHTVMNCCMFCSSFYLWQDNDSVGQNFM